MYVYVDTGWDLRQLSASGVGEKSEKITPPPPQTGRQAEIKTNIAVTIENLLSRLKLTF